MLDNSQIIMAQKGIFSRRSNLEYFACTAPRPHQMKTFLQIFAEEIFINSLKMG